MTKSESSFLDFLNKIIVVILSVGFIGVGMLKLVDYPSITLELLYFGIPSLFIYLIGLVELILAIAIFYKPTRLKALIGGMILMFGAFSLHVWVGDFSRLSGPIFVFIMLIVSFLIEKRK